MVARLRVFLGVSAFVLALAAVSPADEPKAAAGQREQPLPAHTIRRTSDKIAIDGDAAEETWRKAERVSAFVTWDGKETPDVTDVKMAWDDDALYILFVCRDTDIQASITNHDGALYQEDVVEAFIDPEADEKTYMELIVNPLNATLDNYCLCNPRHNMNAGILGWTLKDWQTAVKVAGTVRPPGDAAKNDTDEGWSVEMRIPFSSVALTDGPSGKAPPDGAQWRMALTRYAHPGGKFLHTAWSAPYSPGWPHMTERFGKITFSMKAVDDTR